jgi:hypothetical protein
MLPCLLFCAAHPRSTFRMFARLPGLLRMSEVMGCGQTLNLQCFF